MTASQTLDAKLFEWSSDSPQATELPQLTATWPRFVDRIAITHPDSDHASALHTMAGVDVQSPQVQRFGPRHDEESTLLEKWEGFVTEVHNDGFRARMSANHGDYPKHEVAFEFDELSEGDQAILAVGMPLVWSIIRERRKGGIRRTSILYLRRIAAPDKPEIDAARESLDEWIEGSE